jgi:hypothetical protein
VDGRTASACLAAAVLVLGMTALGVQAHTPAEIQAALGAAHANRL